MLLLRAGVGAVLEETIHSDTSKVPAQGLHLSERPLFLALWAGFLQESLITDRGEEEEAGKGEGKGEEGKEEGEESQIIDLGTLSPLFKNETLFTEANRHKILAYRLIN